MSVCVFVCHSVCELAEHGMLALHDVVRRRIRLAFSQFAVTHVTDK